MVSSTIKIGLAIALGLAGLAMIGVSIWKIVSNQHHGSNGSGGGSVSQPKNVKVSQDPSTRQWYLTWQAPSQTGNTGELYYKVVVTQTNGRPVQSADKLSDTRLDLSSHPGTYNVQVTAYTNTVVGPTATATIQIYGPPSVVSFDFQNRNNLNLTQPIIGIGSCEQAPPSIQSITNAALVASNLGGEAQMTVPGSGKVLDSGKNTFQVTIPPLPTLTLYGVPMSGYTFYISSGPGQLFNKKPAVMNPNTMKSISCGWIPQPDGTISSAIDNSYRWAIDTSNNNRLIVTNVPSGYQKFKLTSNGNISTADGSLYISTQSGTPMFAAQQYATVFEQEYTNGLQILAHTPGLNIKLQCTINNAYGSVSASSPILPLTGA